MHRRSVIIKINLNGILSKIKWRTYKYIHTTFDGNNYYYCLKIKTGKARVLSIIIIIHE